MQVVSVAACRLNRSLDQSLVQRAAEMVGEEITPTVNQRLINTQVRDTHPNLNHTLHLDYFSPSALRFIPKPKMPLDFHLIEKVLTSRCLLQNLPHQDLFR